MFYENMLKTVSRRSALGGLAMATALPAIPAAAAPRGSNLRPLDVLDPRDNIYGFAKMWGTLAPKATLSGYQGVQYAIVGGKRAQALFGYAGFGNMRTEILPDGGMKTIGKEAGFFTDLATGKVLDHWDNPWTGERVEVFNFLNDKLRGSMGLTRTIFKIGDGETANNDHGGKVSRDDPFLLPWQKIGDQYLLGWDYAHEYTNPVTPEGWPKASAGRLRLNPSEHFTIFTPIAEIDDRSNPSARFHAGFMRQAPWWPWMRMGDKGAGGVLMGRMHSYKITGGPEDVPKPILEWTEKHRPDMLEAPVDGPHLGTVDTWSRYAAEVPPETPGYVRKTAS